MARSNTQYNSKVKHFEMKRFYSHSKKLLLLLASEFALLAKNIGKTADQYSRINGEQCAASFAYYAFFSLFPLILLLVVVGTFFIPDRLLAAHRVVEGVEQFVPLQPDGKAILVLTVDNTLNNGWRAGIFGFLALMFYKFAPRRSPPFAHVWMSALIGALLLELGQICFGWYLATFSNFNAIYGVFGTIMGLLLWIYFSGVIMLFCGCVAATNHPPAPGTAHLDSLNSAKN